MVWGKRRRRELMFLQVFRTRITGLELPHL